MSSHHQDSRAVGICPESRGIEPWGVWYRQLAYYPGFSHREPGQGSIRVLFAKFCWTKLGSALLYIALLVTDYIRL